MSNAKRYILISSLAVIAIICGYFIFWGGSPPNDGPQKQTSLTITPTPTPSERSDPAPPTLQVRVLWADDRAAAHGTSVTLTYSDDATSLTEGRRTAKATALTDYSGIASFLIPELSRAGEALIETARDHALPSSATLSLPQASVVDVFTKKTYVIYGMVYRIDETNERLPVNGAEVSAVGVEGAVTYTDANGGFRQLLTSPTVQLLAIAGTQISSINPARAPTHGLVHEIDNGPYIMVLGGEGDLLLSVLSKATMDPIAGASLELKVKDDDSTRLYETDADGICEVVGLSAELVNVKASAPGFAQKFAQLSLKADQANTAILTLSPAAKIHVQTVDKKKRSLGNVVIKLKRSDPNGDYTGDFTLDTTQSDEEGNAVFENAPLGPPIFLQATKGLKLGYKSKKIHVVFKQNEDSARVLLEVTTYTLRARPPNPDYTGDNWVKGRVTDEENRPVPGLKVTLKYSAYTDTQTQTDINGEFAFSELRKGYVSNLSVTGKGYVSVHKQNIKTNSTLELQVSKTVTIKMRVVDAITSAPIQVFNVNVLEGDTRLLDKEALYTDGIAVLSSDGTHTLEDLIPRKHKRIQVKSDYYTPLSKTITPVANGKYNTSKSVFLKVGNETSKSVFLKVGNETSKSVNGASEVGKSSSTGQPFGGQSGQTLEIITAGKTRIRRIKVENSGELVFVLRKSSMIEGQVIDAFTKEPIPNALVGIEGGRGAGSYGIGQSSNDPEVFYSKCANIVLTNDEGKFAFDSYRRKLTLMVRADNYVPKIIGTDRDKNSSMDDGKITLALSKAGTLRIVYPESYVSGLKYLRGVGVKRLSTETPGNIPVTGSDFKISNGNIIEMDYLPDGKYNVYLDLPMPGSPVVDGRVGRTLTIRRFVEISSAKTTTLEIDVSARLSGRVTLDGKPVEAYINLSYEPNASIDKSSVDFWNRCDIVTDEAGYYESPLIPPGDYKVRIFLGRKGFVRPVIVLTGDMEMNYDLQDSDETKKGGG